MRTKPLVIAVICLIAGAAAYTFHPARSGAKSVKPVEPPSPREAVPELTKRQVFEDLVGRWEKTPNNPATRQALCEEAVGKLGVGDEMVEFINFLSASSAAAQREWLLGPGLRPMFAGPAAKAARVWICRAHPRGRWSRHPHLTASRRCSARPRHRSFRCFRPYCLMPTIPTKPSNAFSLLPPTPGRRRDRMPPNPPNVYQVPAPA